VAARERRQRTMLRFGAWTLSIIIVGVVGAAGANAVARHPEPVPLAVTKHSPVRPVAARRESTLTVAAAPVMQQGAPMNAASQPVGDSATRAATNPPIPPAAVATPAPTTDSAAGATHTPPTPPVAPPQPPSAAPPAAVLGPIIPQGRTDLGDSLYAERRADVVVVHFDTSPSRTRRADKFESIVRQTLKAVYGDIADTVLAAVPSGHLAAPNELVTTLPKRGIHLTGPRGLRIGLWPQPRPGRDGPLAIAYRATVER